jgi:predicted Zn finger-like uncharacterized protein
MRIVCPSCDTAYDAPDSVVARGKPMRCARCRTQWTPGKPPEDAAAPPAPPPPLVNAPEYVPEYQPPPDIQAAEAPEPAFEPPPEPRLSRPALPLTAPEPVILAPFPDPIPEPDPPKKTVIAAWVASALVLVIAVWLAIAYRQPIMRGWPASARAYAALGYK